MKNKKFSLKKEYISSWNYIKSCKSFIWSIVLIFFIFSLIGFFITPSDVVSKQIMDFLKELLEKTKGMSALQLIWFIFSNNIQSSFIGLFSGVFLGISSIFIALGNGYILGFVASKSVAVDGILSLWRIFPHGIFELPAVFISLGMGIKLGTFIFQKYKIKSFVEFIIKSFKAFILIVLPLLITAAVIEGVLIALE